MNSKKIKQARDVSSVRKPTAKTLASAPQQPKSVKAATADKPKAVAVKRRQVAAPVKAAAPALPETKKAHLIRLLQSAGGATMDEMTAATGWLPHTIRATISVALRRRLGFNVQHVVSDAGVRRYSIAAA